MFRYLASGVIGAFVALVLWVMLGAGHRVHVEIHEQPVSPRPSVTVSQVSWNDLWRRVTPSVVVVRARPNGGAEDTQGSGAFLSADGVVLTAAHVLRAPDGDPRTAAKDVWVDMADGRQLQARVLGWEPISDLALLKVDLQDAPPLPMAAEDSLRVGDPVASIGAPYGQTGSLSVGIISGLHRSTPSSVPRFALNDLVQTDAAVNPGNSGGPLVDSQGRLIGVIARFESDTRANSGVGYAVGMGRVRALLPRLRAGGLVKLGYAGITGQTLSPFLARQLGLSSSQGVLVARIAEDSPASRSSLRAGTGTLNIAGQQYPRGADVITAVNGDPVRSSAELADALSVLAPGSRAQLTVTRAEGARHTVSVVLATRALR